MCARWSAAACFFVLLAPPVASGRQIVVTIGIPHFFLDHYLAPEQDAKLFAGRIQVDMPAFSSRADDGLLAIYQTLNLGLNQARPDDTVWLFLSTRGLAPPFATNGYIGGADFASGKESSTGVS